MLRHIKAHRDRDDRPALEFERAGDMGRNFDRDQRSVHRLAGDQPLGFRTRGRAHHARHRAEQLHEIGDVVRAHVKHRAAAAQIIETRRRMPALMAGAAEERAAGHGRADRVIVDQLARGLVPTAQERIGRATDAKILLRGELHHLAGFGDVNAERLLGMNVLAGVQHRQADVGVGEWHSEIDDDLDVVSLEQLINPHRRQPEGGALPLCRIAAHIGERLDFHDREALGRLQISGADIAAADDADADFSHCDLREVPFIP
ncbi:hypothetical protein ACVWZ6_004426 [Bradyrhizobium sp. GM6.1]